MSTQNTEWQMVPKRATAEMIFALQEAAQRAHCLASQEHWAAMLASAPTAPQEGAKPVAWLWVNPNGSKEATFVPPEEDADFNTILALELGREYTPLYTRPLPDQEAMRGASTSAVQDAIREAGGIVHSDGNIFFTNAEKYLASVRALAPTISATGAQAGMAQQKVDRPIGCALAMRVMQSDLFQRLDEAERADCEELVRQNVDWLKHDAAAGIPKGGDRG